MIANFVSLVHLFVLFVYMQLQPSSGTTLMGIAKQMKL